MRTQLLIFFSARSLAIGKRTGRSELAEIDRPTPATQRTSAKAERRFGRTHCLKLNLQRPLGPRLTLQKRRTSGNEISRIDIHRKSTDRSM